MTMIEQYAIAEEVKVFLSKWGLKRKFVAEVCQIPETVFSKFLNNKVVLSSKQIERVTAYIEDYIRRNS